MKKPKTFRESVPMVLGFLVFSVLAFGSAGVVVASEGTLKGKYVAVGGGWGCDCKPEPAEAQCYCMTE